MCKMNTIKYNNSTLLENQKDSDIRKRFSVNSLRVLDMTPFILLVSLVLSTLQLHAASIKDDFFYKNLNSDNGLSQNFVDYIYQDSEGFLWFATWGGLDRFDGYEVKQYNTQNHLLHSNFTHCIAEDSF